MYYETDARIKHGSQLSVTEMKLSSTSLVVIAEVLCIVVPNSEYPRCFLRDEITCIYSVYKMFFCCRAGVSQGQPYHLTSYTTACSHLYHTPFKNTPTPPPYTNCGLSLRTTLCYYRGTDSHHQASISISHISYLIPPCRSCSSYSDGGRGHQLR